MYIHVHTRWFISEHTCTHVKVYQHTYMYTRDSLSAYIHVHTQWLISTRDGLSAYIHVHTWWVISKRDGLFVYIHVHTRWFLAVNVQANKQQSRKIITSRRMFVSIWTKTYANYTSQRLDCVLYLTHKTHTTHTACTTRRHTQNAPQNYFSSNAWQGQKKYLSHISPIITTCQ